MKYHGLTPWYPMNIKPARIGVYQADWNIPSPAFENDVWYAYFDGKEWGWMQPNPDKALRSYQMEQHRRHAYLIWRGIAK